MARSRLSLSAENAILRHQLAVLQRGRTRTVLRPPPLGAPFWPGKTGRSYRCALDLWLGEVLCIKGIPIPYGAPNAQAHIERFMGSLKKGV